jgi:hypothetical protein
MELNWLSLEGLIGNFSCGYWDESIKKYKLFKNYVLWSAYIFLYGSYTPVVRGSRIFRLIPACIYFTRGEENLWWHAIHLSSIMTLPFENLQNQFYILWRF